MAFFKEIWQFFLKHIWPLIWPIIRDTIVEVVKDVLAWLKRKLSDVLSKHAEAQERQAEQRAKDADEAARKATSHDEQIAAKAEAAAWSKVADELRKENKDLRSKLDEILSQGEKFAEERIESEAIKGAAHDKVLSLPQPDNAPDREKSEP